MEETVIRYTVTHIGKNGLRTLCFAAQGRYTWATAEEAQAQMDALTQNNSEERLREFYGLPLQVRPVQCWPVHHDPRQIWFDADYLLDPTKEHAK